MDRKTNLHNYATKMIDSLISCLRAAAAAYYHIPEIVFDALFPLSNVPFPPETQRSKITWRPGSSECVLKAKSRLQMHMHFFLIWAWLSDGVRWETGCQLDLRSCIMPRLFTHLVQEFYVGTVPFQPTNGPGFQAFSNKFCSNLCYFWIWLWN